MFGKIDVVYVFKV